MLPSLGITKSNTTCCLSTSNLLASTILSVWVWRSHGITIQRFSLGSCLLWWTPASMDVAKKKRTLLGSCSAHVCPLQLTQQLNSDSLGLVAEAWIVRFFTLKYILFQIQIRVEKWLEQVIKLESRLFTGTLASCSWAPQLVARRQSGSQSLITVSHNAERQNVVSEEAECQQFLAGWAFGLFRCRERTECTHFHIHVTAENVFFFVRLKLKYRENHRGCV